MGDVHGDLRPRFQPERGGPFVRAEREQALERDDVAAQCMPSRDAVELAQLLERIDPRVRVRADAESDPPFAYAIDRRVAVAQIRLRRGTDADPRARIAHQVELDVRSMRRVHDRRPRREAARAREKLDRADAVFLQALLDLPWLLARVHVQNEALALGVASDLLEPFAGAGANGVGGKPDAEAALAQRLNLPEVLRRRALAELREPAAAVRRVKEHELDAGLGGRIGNRERLLETEVVELPDGGVARGDELAVGANVVAPHMFGSLAGGEREHRVAPGPEVAARALAPQSALEGVTVRVDEPRQRERLRHARIVGDAGGRRP